MDTKIDPVLTDIDKINKLDRSYLVYHFLFKDLKASIEQYAKGRLIDIGCGNKPYEKLFNNRIDEYLGCDISQNAFNSVDVVCDVSKIPLENESFDTAFCTQVIEHVADHKSLLKEACRLLKRGGVLIISGPQYWPVHGEPYDFFRFTHFGFEYILKEAGFKIIKTHSNGGIWATAGQGVVHAFEFSQRQSFLFRMLRFVFFRLKFVWVVNSVFRWLDKKDYSAVNTINYVVVAQKK